ncbi:MAG: O-methyltransferase [Chitinophagaceae bacterium]|nr:O-methyltransferase [Chitinophagaceae bacterium]
MIITNSLAEKYAEWLTNNDDELLTQIHQSTSQNHAHAHMLSGHVQGMLLTFMSTLLNPHNILEIGTFTGYSALCLAKGLTVDGQLHTIEIREEDAKIAQENFNKSQYSKQLFLHIGNALEIIPTLNKTWDLIFIDADKTGYIKYYEMVLPLLNKNGLIIVDNILFHGQVLETDIKGKNAIAMDNFNKHIAQDTSVNKVLLTVRDGLLFIKKK